MSNNSKCKQKVLFIYSSSQNATFYNSFSSFQDLTFFDLKNARMKFDSTEGGIKTKHFSFKIY